MNLPKSFLLGLLLVSLNHSAFALDPSSQAVLDAYKAPFDTYFQSITEMGNALKSYKGDTDLTKIVDKFCDEANKFVDQYTGVQDQYQDSQVLQSMNNNAEAKKAVTDFMQDIQKKFQADKSIFDGLLKQLNKYPSSAQIKRVKDRLYWTIQRVQGISPY
jgi:hypothetical protein